MRAGEEAERDHRDRATTCGAPADERVRQVGLVSRLLARPEVGAIVAVVLVYVFLAVVAFDNNFISWQATAAILNTAAPLGILAVAVALLMIAGEFDLSIGSIVGFAGMTIMVLVTAQAGGRVRLVVLACRSGGSGALAADRCLQRGLGDEHQAPVVHHHAGFALHIPRTDHRAHTVADQPDPVGRSRPGGRVRVGATHPRRSTHLRRGPVQHHHPVVDPAHHPRHLGVAPDTQGNWIFGAGGDANAARNVGVPVTRLKVALFMTTAVAAFLVALLQVVQFTGADTLRGTQLEFRAIIAAVVGGNLLTGGYGSAVGASLGALTFAMIDQGIRLTGVDADWFQVVLGAVLVAAVLFNNWIRRRAAKR